MVLRLVFGKPGQVAVVLVGGLLLWQDPGGVVSGTLAWVARLLADNVVHALVPAGS